MPASANQWFELGVVRFAVRSLGRTDVAEALVCAPKDKTGNTEGHKSAFRGLDAWLVTFEDAMATRTGPILDWSGGFHAPRPADFDAGAWEVSPSSWLERVAARYGRAAHHFVLTYNDVLYEVIAAHWRSEPRPESEVDW